MTNLFFFLSPILIYTVSGSSMQPSYASGEKVLAAKKWFITLRKNDVVIAKDPRNGRLLLKRIKEISTTPDIQAQNTSGMYRKKRYFLVGDNENESTDSRNYGWVNEHLVLAKVIYSKS